MLGSLKDFDIELFYWINHGLKNSFFDWYMPFITRIDNWLIPLIIITLILMTRGGKKGRIFCVSMIIIITISDQLCSSLLKPFFDRPRPSTVLADVNLLIGFKSSMSFPSSHAVNAFAVGVFSSFYYKRWMPVFLMLSVSVAISRVYIGVHFPFDIIAGGILGTCMAFTGKYAIYYLEGKRPLFTNGIPVYPVEINDKI